MPKANSALITSERAAPTRYTSATHYDIKTATGLVDALGGEDAVAKEFGVTPQSVRAWGISGHIPNGWHLRLFAWVCVINKTISPSVFGFRDRNKAGLALSDLMMAARRDAEGGEDV